MNRVCKQIVRSHEKLSVCTISEKKYYFHVPFRVLYEGEINQRLMSMWQVNM